MDELRTVGRNIAKYRTLRKMTQEDLAFEAEMDRPYLSLIENGKGNLSIKILMKIAKALGCKIDDLVKTD